MRLLMRLIFIVLTISSFSVCQADQESVPNAIDIQKADNDNLIREGANTNLLIKVVELLGCKEQTNKPGYYCDIIFTQGKSSDTKISSGRYVKSSKGWIRVE